MSKQRCEFNQLGAVRDFPDELDMVTEDGTERGTRVMRGDLSGCQSKGVML